MSSFQIARESAGGSIVLFSGNLLSTALSGTASVIFARLLGPDAYGLYTLTFVIPSIFLLFTGFGTTTAVSRYSAYYLSKGEVDRAKDVTRRGMATSLGLGAALSLTNYLAGPYLVASFLRREALVPDVQLASLFVMGVAAAQASTSAFIGWGSMGKVSLVNVLQSVLKLTVGPGLILLGLGVYGAIVGNVAAYVFQGAVATFAILAMRLSMSSTTAVSFAADLKMMIGYGLPTLAGGIVSGVAVQYLTILLAEVATNAVIGYYQAAINVATTISIISSAMSTVLLWSFSSLDGIKADMSQAFDYAVRYVSLLLTPVVFFLAAGAGALVDLIYTSSYTPGTILLVIAALSYSPVAIGLLVISPFLNGLGRTKLTLVLSLVTAVSMVVGGLVFASWLHGGAEGIIIAILVSNLLTAAIGLLISSRYGLARVNPGPLVGILGAAIAAYGAARVVSGTVTFSALEYLIVDLVVFVFVYLTTVPIFRGIGRDDLERLRLATGHIVLYGPLVGWILKYEKWILKRTAGKSTSEKPPT